MTDLVSRMRRGGFAAVLWAFVGLGILAAGCRPAGDTTAEPGAPVATATGGTLTGAGATFPALLYQRWAEEYRQATGTQVNYQSIGSSGGIKNAIARSVDFGATDGPLSDEELQSAPTLLHIPTVAGAVVLAYNLADIPGHLNLTGPVIADIYLGQITRWNDAAIAALNPGIALPDRAIVPTFRSDGSGTTRIFTNYLSQVSPAWQQRVGTANSVRFPTGIGGKGNEGVTASVNQNPGALGYIEFAYAEANKLNYAAVQNQSGNFVVPSLEATTIAAEGADLPDDFRQIITNTAAPQGYPISGFTWILVHQDARPEVRQFLQWALTQGQETADNHGYAPLPESVRQQALAAVERIGAQPAGQAAGTTAQ